MQAGRARSKRIIVLIAIGPGRCALIVSIGPLGLLLTFDGGILDETGLGGPTWCAFTIGVVANVLQIAVKERIRINTRL